MLRVFFLDDDKKKQLLLGLVTIVVTLLGGWASVFLPSFWMTLTIGLIGFLVVIARPMLGMSLLFCVLYFPVFPIVPFGLVEFSASTLLVVGLAVASLMKIRQSSKLLNWQWGILLSLGAAFLLATIFGTSFMSSLRFLPNLVIYILVLFSIMVQVDTPKKIWELARLIVILGFLISIWRVELGPFRAILGFPSLGANGAVFEFHPPVALAIAMLVFPSLRKELSTPWRIFILIALFSLIIHGVIMQTRSAWLAWIIILILVFLQMRGRNRLIVFLLSFSLFIVAAVFFRNTIITNLTQTQGTLATVIEGDQSAIGSSDLIRLRARDAGWRMFLERPVLGWGPNQFNYLKPIFVYGNGKESRYPGAFNAWLIYLSEMGALTVAVAAVAFITPFIIIWWQFRFRRGDFLVELAYGFALGTLAVGFHLFFVDLFYSFAWAQVGLGLAAVRLVLANAEEITTGRTDVLR